MDQGSVPTSRARRLLRVFEGPPPGGRLAGRIEHLKARLWLVVVLVLACAVYVYFASAGGMRNWPVYGIYLDLQADAFRLGHLYVPLEPARELVQAADPYDRVNIRYWAPDLSYFRGRYYVYWGPLPALLQAAVKALLGITHVVGDQYIGLYSACLATLGGGLIIERMARRLFGSVPKFVVVFGILAFAFANPMLHNVTTAGTYQSAILAGQGWLLPGLALAFEAVWHGGTDAARRYRLLLAGVCWAFAVGSRVTVLPTVALFIGATALAESWGSERRWRKALVNSLWLGVPVAATGFALLAYNQLRFGNPFEFGLKLQLSGYPRLERFESQFWLPNLYSYTFRPFALSCQFPYVFQEWWISSSTAFPSWMTLPKGYYNMDEPVIGWLRAVPITWFIGFALLLVPRPRALHFRHGRVYLWCLVSFSALASLTGLTALGVYATTMRYLSDVTPGLVLLALLGAFALRASRFGLLAPKLTSTTIALLASATIVFGCLLGYQGYAGHFHKYNPELDAKLVQTFSFCGNSKPIVPRFSP